MRNPFARFLVKEKKESPEQQAKPKGKFASANDTKLKFFDDRKKNLAKYETIYKQGGMVTEAINTYPLYILTNGYRFESDDEALKEMVEEKCEELDLDMCIYQGVVDALWAGDGYQEIAPSKTEDVGMVFPRPAITFKTNYDEFGVVTGYEQNIETNILNKGTPIPFKPEEIIHIVLNRVGGSPTGISLIERCYDDIMRDARIAEASAAAVERHGFPKYHIRVGAENEDIPREDMLSIANQFQDLHSKNEFVTVRDVEIQSIDTAGMNIQEYGNWAIQRLCSALGVPEEMLGLGRGSTEATANVRLQAFYDKVATYQKRIARIYNTQLIDKITGKPGAVKLVFNDVSPVDDELKARMITMVMNATPGDPFAVMPLEWVRKQFDIEAEEYETQEDELDEGLLDEQIPGEGEATEAQGEQTDTEGNGGDEFAMPQLEHLSTSQLRSMAGTKEGACKAARARGDKVGPECGGGDEPSAPKKKGQPDDKKKQKKSGSDGSTSHPEETSQTQKNGGHPFKGEFKLSPEGQLMVGFIKENRQKIGKPTMNYPLGLAGELVMRELFERFEAHEGWNDVQDLGNAMLYDVKTLNPQSEGTPVLSDALKRKQEATRNSGKKWQFPLIVTEEDRARVYLHTASEKFYNLKPEKGDYYKVPVDKGDYIGYVDKDMTFHPEGKFAKEGKQ